MRIKDIYEQMSKQDVINIMSELGATHKDMSNSDNIAFKTICHEGGNSHKLIYFHKTKSFYCFTGCCCSYTLISLISNVLGYDKNRAFYWLCEKLNINVGFEILAGFQQQHSDISFIYKFDDDEYQEKTQGPLKEYNEKVLDNFYHMYHKSWIEEHISIEVMKQFGIRYDIYYNRIIIPHYDINNRLIGIKVRNLQQKYIDAGRKYIPLTYNKKFYNYPTSLNLYGIHLNKNAIKKYKKVIIFESEKAVLQHKSFYGDDSIAVAISGSAISSYQINLLKNLGVETVILALDKEFSIVEDEEDWFYRKKIHKGFIKKMKLFFKMELIWDLNNDLEKKMAPTDKGKEIFEKLFRKRIIF